MNKETSIVPSTILRNKLAKNAIRLQQQVKLSGSNNDFNTQEKVLREAIKILSQFYKDLQAPVFIPNVLLPDTLPDPYVFNENMQLISDDLSVVFAEFENLEDLTLGNFNYMVSRLNRLNRRLKSSYSKLGDFILFSRNPTKDAIYFSDSFNNLDRVEIDSPLLNEEQCEVNQVEGIVTLPVSRSEQIPISITLIPVVNSNSNGTPGNNQEEGVALHGNIMDILDNNADSWFEYERVVSEDDGVALVFDFTVNLGESKIVNFVRVNPNNFGTRTQVEILAIDTSIDGDKFVSIKDDIPIADFVFQDEANVFTLAPSTSKYAGQGLYTFSPRKAKYIHFTLRQSTAYVIQATDGTEKLRYAIGIRDIEVQALPYKNKGELISSEYSSSDEIRKVVLLSNQNPDSEFNSILASIQHFISPDNGQTWHAIRPKVSVGQANIDQEIPELLDFNGVSEGSIATANPVFSVRYKALLQRNDEAFTEDAAELAQVIESNTELHTVPSTTPFDIILENSPIDGTLKLIDPQYGSRGFEDIHYQIAQGDGSKKKVYLPFKPLVRDFQKVFYGSEWTLRDLDPEKVYVNGDLWSRELNTTSSAATAKHYSLNYEEGILEFGDGTKGKAVPDGASISMHFNEERLFPSRGADHIAVLNYPVSNDQKQFEVDLVYPPQAKAIVLKKGAKRHQLVTDILYDIDTDLSYTTGQYDITLSDSSVFQTEKVFQNGTVELTASGQYTFDFKNGVLYSYAPTSSSVDTTVVLHHRPRTRLSEFQWKFVDANDGIGNAISISDNIFTTFAKSDLVIPSGVTYFNLEHLAVVKGTVEFKDIDTQLIPDSLSQEVEFIDGRTELLAAIQASQQLEPLLGISPTGEIRQIVFALSVSPDASFSVTFSNQNVFQVSKNSLGAVVLVGDYFVDRTAKLVYVKVDEDILDPGIMNYYYTDPRANLSGRYSINYETGEVFCFNATEQNIEADYEYTDFRVRYHIAREISSENYIFIAEEKTIRIKDREILTNIRTPKSIEAGGAGLIKYYQASYDYIKESRQDVDELADYFSPVLKDYALKVITRNRLI